MLGCLNLATQTIPLTNAAESHIYLKAVYKISTGRNMHFSYVETMMSPNCSILASIFQKFPGGIPPDPLVLVCEGVLCIPPSKRLVP